MAVQAQYPSNVLLMDQKRPPQFNYTAMDSTNPSPGSSVALLGTVEDPPHIPNNYLQNFYNSASLMTSQHASVNPLNNEGCEIINTEAAIATGLINAAMNTGSRKRSRTDMLTMDTLIAPRINIQQQINNPLVSLYQQKTDIAALTEPQFLIPKLPISTVSGVSQMDDSMLIRQSTVVNSANSNMINDRSFASANGLSGLSNELATQYLQQKNEIEQLVAFQTEKLRQLLEEKRQQQTRAMVAMAEEGVRKRMREKDDEVNRIHRRNFALEERVKQLSMDCQIWQNVARKNEAMVYTLRSSLEQAMAEQSARTCCNAGETSVDDAESCNEGGIAVADKNTDLCFTSNQYHHHHQQQQLQHQTEAMAMAATNSVRLCRVCRRNQSCVLVLPCRHLCLCKDCDASPVASHHCPVCNSPKDASIPVYLD